MIVKEDIAGSCKKKLLTFCQFRRTRVGFRTIRRDIGETWHAITHFLSSEQEWSAKTSHKKGDSWSCWHESLTNYEVNKTRVEGKYDMRFNWTWHEITYPLTNRITVKGLWENAWLVLRLNHLHPKKKVGLEDHDKGHILIRNEIAYPL